MMRFYLYAATLALGHCLVSGLAQAETLSKADLRDIDDLAVQLLDNTKKLHDEYHEHFDGARHAEKLDDDVSALEKLAEGLHDFAHDADAGHQSLGRLRKDTNEFIQLSVRIYRTLGLIEPWLRNRDQRRGISHMTTAAKEAIHIAHRIDRYLPVDTRVIDFQADSMEGAVKELHDEFHKHLEGYEISHHLDEDLEKLEKFVEHIHDLTHDKTWSQINLHHLEEDISEVKSKAIHIEALLDRQARIGVRSRDWIGFDHTRDAITDTLSSAYLLEHMIRKAKPDYDHGTSHDRVAGHGGRHGRRLGDRDLRWLSDHLPSRHRRGYHEEDHSRYRSGYRGGHARHFEEERHDRHHRD